MFDALEAIRFADDRARRTGEPRYIVAHEAGFSVCTHDQVIRYGWQDRVVERVSP